jgi:hypothetical protein
MDNFITEQYNFHKSKLDGFTYINHDNLYLIKTGGTIKYINLNGDLMYGGIIIKILDTDKYTTLNFLLKIGNDFRKLSYTKNYIFYSEPIKNKKKKILKELLTELFT